MPYNVKKYILNSFSVRLVGNLFDSHTRYLSITEKEESLGCHGNMYNWFHWWNNSYHSGKQILIQDNLWCIEVECLCICLKGYGTLSFTHIRPFISFSSVHPALVSSQWPLFSKSFEIYTHEVRHYKRKAKFNFRL